MPSSDKDKLSFFTTPVTLDYVESSIMFYYSISLDPSSSPFLFPLSYLLLYYFHLYRFCKFLFSPFVSFYNLVSRYTTFHLPKPKETPRLSPPRQARRAGYWSNVMEALEKVPVKEIKETAETLSTVSPPLAVVVPAVVKGFGLLKYGTWGIGTIAFFLVAQKLPKAQPIKMISSLTTSTVAKFKSKSKLETKTLTDVKADTKLVGGSTTVDVKNPTNLKSETNHVTNINYSGSDGNRSPTRRRSSDRAFSLKGFVPVRSVDAEGRVVRWSRDGVPESLSASTLGAFDVFANLRTSKFKACCGESSVLESQGSNNSVTDDPKWNFERIESSTSKVNNTNTRKSGKQNADRPKERCLSDEIGALSSDSMSSIGTLNEETYEDCVFMMSNNFKDTFSERFVTQHLWNGKGNLPSTSGLFGYTVRRVDCCLKSKLAKKQFKPTDMFMLDNPEMEHNGKFFYANEFRGVKSFQKFQYPLIDSANPMDPISEK
jgi:hypothetical protein